MNSNSTTNSVKTDSGRCSDIYTDEIKKQINTLKRFREAWLRFPGDWATSLFQYADPDFYFFRFTIDRQEKSTEPFLIRVILRIMERYGIVFEIPADTFAFVITEAGRKKGYRFEDFYMAHVDDDADMTVASVPYMVSVPYGIFVLEGNRILDVEEKPTYNYYANAGIYLIKRRWLDIIPRGEYFDATQFIDAMIKKGGKVTHFPIEGTWIDIGSPNDFKHAQDLMKHRKGLNQI